jgi:hypothetical protein
MFVSSSWLFDTLDSIKIVITENVKEDQYNPEHKNRDQIFSDSKLNLLVVNID